MPKKLNSTLSLKLDEETHRKIQLIAERNNLPVTSVLRMMLSRTLPTIEKEGLTILPA